VKTSAWRRLRRVVIGVAVAVVLVVAVVAILLAGQPPFYRRAIAAGTGGPEGEARARRLVTKVSALHAALSRPPARRDGEAGRWEAAIGAEELNAWLAIDLPRSHPTWLPRGVTAPRVGFQRRHAEVAARVGYGPVSAVAALDLEIVLRDVGQIGIVVERASLGAIPLPRDAIVRAMAGRLGRLGIATDLRRLDGRLVLVAHLPAPRGAAEARPSIETLALVDGELIVAGSTASAVRAPVGPGSGSPAP
jgi:hypothetical protein